MQLVEQIKNSNGQIMAIIISHRFNEKGIHFFTPDEFSQQLAYMNHPKGKIIDPHYHNAVQRNVVFTQEVLIIKKGKLKVDFYDDVLNYTESRILEDGDVILLSAGGHGFEVIEDVEMIEVKQGPYQGESDKTRFIKKD
jgi:mannose-6-phosphate isomerase-like protein (cupin superfamily)